MHLYYWKSRRGNFGDDLNADLWPRVFGEGFFDDDPTERFLGIGSILTDGHIPEDLQRLVVFGSGMRNGRGLARLPKDTHIAFVRGPNSARALEKMGYNAEYISDPAILMPRHFNDPTKQHSDRIGFVPYFKTSSPAFSAMLDDLGLVEIPTTLPVETFLSELRTCSHVICEAMHGAIVADAYRIPWTGCRILNVLEEGRTSRFKWSDWMQSLAIDARIHETLPILPMLLNRANRWRLQPIVERRTRQCFERILARPDWHLSTDANLTRAQDRIQEKAYQLKTYHA
ncbi:succinoglycan biosynthesis protein ExoV [Roseovarius pacificus]|uniref:Succinoglycan biosynthesis protein ExoV n=1 Tax=Roseovarius pacificus TaxID=337701 RepID=A0A1M7HM11_9RHOB|nr:polysaccharide pyruvyl transferase family protein [Roseovarius pacificus]GGO60662.1 hypothetical protein GCM10011315_35610 [Roseovarius pacificus]SHM29494.1 succinoglycan biosynthesis protein ExoV [Roseovarius pacificus]